MGVLSFSLPAIAVAKHLSEAFWLHHKHLARGTLEAQQQHDA